jgi:serine phosphatase RsbU (regulator of sigma subunit)
MPFQVNFFHDGASKPVSLPHIWTQDPALKNLKQGQYELVIPASDGADLALLINPKHTQNTIVYQVFRNEQEIFRFGNPDQPDRLTDLIIPGKPIVIEASREPIVLKIVVTSNRHTLWPGIHKISLEPLQQYERRAYLDALIAVGLMGAIIIVAFYHAMLWILNRKERNQIFFVAFCMMVLIFAGLHISRVFFQFYSVNVHLYWMLQSLAWFGSMAFVDAFSYAIFPQQYPSKKLRITLSIAVICWIGNFFSLYSMLVFQVYSWIFLGHIVIFASRLARTPKRENLLFTLIYVLLITGTLIDLASGIDLLNVPALMPLCFFGIICIESYLLSYVNQQTAQRLMKEELQREEVEESMLAVQGLRERIDQSDQLIPGLQVHSFYRPAERFGGDWLSLTYLSESKHSIILVGDVTGHGIGSGLLAVSIGATIHGALSVLESMGKSLSIEEKLDYIAQAIHYAVMDISKRLNKGMTLALIGMDLEKGYCVVRNHGHPFPYLMRGDSVKILMARGSLLGTEDVPSADVVRLDFQPGDKIFVYTDGLIENRNQEGKVLPRRELERTLLAASRNNEKHIEKFEQYTCAATEDSQDADDLAYLYLEWKKAS